MTRNRRGFGAIAAALLALGCQQQTAVHIVPPEDGTVVLSFVLEVHESGVCARLAEHDRDACQRGSCGEAFDPGEPLTPSREYDVTADGVMPRGVPLGRDRSPRDVFVVARLADGSRAYGCAPFTPGGRVETIRLAYPLCEALPACVEAHEDCDVGADCMQRFLDRRNPPCELREGAARAWRGADGVLCDPSPSALASSLATNESLGVCSPALRDCATGNLLATGVCPERRAEPCLDGTRVYDPTQDYDCNRGHPICGDDGCVGDRQEQCTVGGCVGQRSCQAGRWTDCVFEQEQCGGGDEDCDGLVDETAGMCSAGVLPRGDGCASDGTCVCGAGPECTEGRACCGSACVDPRADVAHCGGCGIPCRGRCVRGVCELPDAGLDAGTLDAGRPPPPPDAGPVCRDISHCSVYGDRVDACQNNLCRCGSGPVCARGFTCCRGQCVTLDTNGFSVFNCGVCGCGCRSCAAGVCQDDGGCQIVLDAGSADGG